MFLSIISLCNYFIHCFYQLYYCIFISYILFINYITVCIYFIHSFHKIFHCIYFMHSFLINYRYITVYLFHTFFLSAISLCVFISYILYINCITVHFFIHSNYQLYHYAFISYIVFSCDQAALRTLLSVRLSVCHTFFTMFLSSYHHEIFRSYYHWQKWCPCKRSRSKVKGQGHRGHDPT